MNAKLAAQCNNASRQNERSVFEFRICKAWRQAGKMWTDAELEAAIHAELERLAARRGAELEQELGNRDAKPKQLELINTGRHAAETRAEAIKQLDNKGSIKRALIEALTQAGRYGQTRWQLSQKIGCQQSSLTSTCLDLLREGSVVETDERRESGVGGRGCVLVLSSFVEGRQQ